MIVQGAAKSTVMDQLKPFEGHWKGNIGMGPMKFDVDMTWKPFGGRWAEVSYTYTAPSMKLEFRVLMTHNAENKGFDCWMFGNDFPHPDQMKGVMDGKTLVVLHNRENAPDVRFWIDEDKNLVMRILQADGKTEMGKGLLKPVKN